jgi:6-phosphofructokinase
MRCSFIDCSLEEVKQRQYQHLNHDIIVITDEVIISDDKVDFLKEKNKEVKERRDKVDAKARNLLTLTSLLLGLISSANSIASAKTSGILSVLPLTILFVTIFLLTNYFGINRSKTTNYSYVLLASNSRKNVLCNELIKSQDYNERVTDFLVDLYHSALRYFSIAMLLILFFGIENIFRSINN